MCTIFADILLFSYETEFIYRLIKQGDKCIAGSFNFTFRYIVDVSKHNSFPRLASSHITLQQSLKSGTLHIIVYFGLINVHVPGYTCLQYDSNDQLSTKLYDKREWFWLLHRELSIPRQQHAHFFGLKCLYIAVNTISQTLLMISELHWPKLSILTRQLIDKGFEKSRLTRHWRSSDL